MLATNSGMVPAWAEGGACQSKRVSGDHVAIQVSFRSNKASGAVTQGGIAKATHNAAA